MKQYRFDTFSIKLEKTAGRLHDCTNIMTSPKAVSDVLRDVVGLHEYPTERFVVLSLSTKNKIIGVDTLHVGGISSSLVDARTVFQTALLHNASNIIIAHNHPSGDLTPSPEDISVTDRLAELGHLHDIPVHDHFIVTHSDDSPDGFAYISMREQSYGRF